jgi:predicted nuclease of predicted toxin-antitoxin system
MKFIVDAQLPKSLADYITLKGYSAVHTLDLPDKNKTKDTYITQLATTEKWIVISKDADFLESHILRNEPPKLLLLKTGNIRNSELLTLFDKHFDFLVELLSKHALIEFTKEEIVIHA